jgi:propanediol dehydratase small subunit
MDSEELIRQIMGEVMANLNQDNVAFDKVSAPASGSRPAGARVDRSSYPLGEKVPQQIKISIWTSTVGIHLRQGEER